MGLGSYRDVEQTVGRRPALDLATKDSDQVGPQGDEIVPAVLRDGGGQADDRDRPAEI